MKKAEIIKNGNVNFGGINFCEALKKYNRKYKIKRVDWYELKSDFFKEFGDSSFRGYPLEQCHLIFEWFKKRLS